MTLIEVELFTTPGNNAVIRLPGRRFPGVVIQGDTLHSMVITTSEALSALMQGDTSTAQELLQESVEQLRDAQERYAAALQEHGLALPY
ncbi:hypothetical protein HUA74_14150 [Myxococcus sp. CA051A]|uniref:DUF6959 family protein n=1 Tax=unclassified Myxococcus TaxID=2648731 RepID=UPI00157B20B4|nr:MULTISPECIES: hypothetical protein [unclassified Myxococcus]NTX52681.1 hypothetical protein [Myxococcus sp. CA039A]NTX61801.1 hypothetical protein [Myxococcus sp. CA051A]